MRALLRHELYEPRLVAVCIPDFRARLKRISEDERRELYELYLAGHDHIDSWDLVDRAAPRVIGGYLVGKDPEPLYALAQHPSTWRRRTAITAAFTLIRAGELDAPVRLIDLLLDDPEHFVQTSVGVALRELNRASPKRCEEFLAGNRDRLSSTTKRLMRDSRRSSYLRLAAPPVVPVRRGANRSVDRNAQLTGSPSTAPSVLGCQPSAGAT